MTKKLTPEILSVNPLPSLLWPRLPQGPLSCTGESLPRSQRDFATAAQQGSKQCTWSPDLLRQKIPRRREGVPSGLFFQAPAAQKSNSWTSGISTPWEPLGNAESQAHPDLRVHICTWKGCPGDFSQWHRATACARASYPEPPS